MGSFDGGLAYTFYPGSRLVHQEAVLTTYDADVAYYYDAGLDMAAASGSSAGQQHAHRGRVLRHRRRVAAHDADRVTGRTRARSGALPDARAEDGGRQRRRVPGAAPVLLPARLHLESGLRVASRLARTRRARHQAAARRELAVLPVGERAAGTAAAHERVLSARFRRPGGGARARASVTRTRIAFERSTDTRRSAPTGISPTPFRRSPTGRNGRRRSSQC